MRVFLEPEVLKWLANVLCIDPTTINYTLNNSGKCEVRAEDLIEEIGLGLTMGEVIKALRSLNRGVLGDLKDTAKLDLLKKTKSGGARAYNWNILFEQLQALLDLKVDKETKDLVLASDYQTTADLLATVYTKSKLRGLRMNMVGAGPIVPPGQGLKEKRKLAPTKPQSTATEPLQDESQGVLNRLNRSVRSEMPGGQQDLGPALFKEDLGNAGELNLETFDPFIEYANAPSCLAFILLGICKNIQINALQAASLLANGNKYLSQLIVKGKKGNFAPVLNMLGDVYRHIGVLSALIEQEESQGSVKFVLQAFKGVFHSNNIDVCKFGCRIYSKVLYELANKEFLPDAWEWFGTLYGGFFAIKAAFDHWADDALDSLCSVLTQIGRFSCSEMFTVELRKVHPNPFEYVRFTAHFLRPLSGSKLIKDDIQNGGVFEYLFEMAMKSDEPEHSKNTEFRIVALDLIRQLWILYPYKFEADATLGNSALSFMKRSSRMAGLHIKVCIYGYLFNLLAQFASDRNPYAPVVYKMIVFSYIEHFKDNTVREFLSLNLKRLMVKIPSLPVSILVEPYAKQLGLMTDDTGLSIIDVELLRSVVAHPRLTAPSAIQLFNSLAKLFLSSNTFTQALSTLILAILRRHIESDLFCEYAVKFVGVSLASLYKSFTNGSAQRLADAQRLGVLHSDASSPTDTEVVKELQHKNWRAVVVNTLRDLILLGQSKVNDNLEDRILYTDREVTKYRAGLQYKGMLVLLSALGGDSDPQIRIREYDIERKAIEDLKQANLKVNNFVGNRKLDDLDSQTEAFRREFQLDGGRNKLQLDEEITVKTGSQFNPAEDRDKRTFKMGGAKKGMGSASMQNTNGKTPDDYDELEGPRTATEPYLKPKVQRRNQMREDEDGLSDEGIEELNKKLGVKLGLKDRVKQLEKEQREMSARQPRKGAWKDKNAADPKLKKYLETLQAKKDLKKVKALESELQQKIKEEKVRKQLDEDLQWRRKLNPMKENEMLVNLGVGEIYQKISPTTNQIAALESFTLIDPIDGQEELIDKELISIIFNKHKSSLQYLFKKYANSIQDKSAATFEMLGKRVSNLSLPELTKMLADYYISELVDKQEVAVLVRMINEAVSSPNTFAEPVAQGGRAGQYPQGPGGQNPQNNQGVKNLKFLDYNGFLKFLCNLAFIIHTREPVYEPHLALPVMVQNLLDMLDKGRRLKGDPYPNFGDLSSQPKYLQQKDTLDLLNYRLQQDPEFVLPPVAISLTLDFSQST